ncbi:MAG: hypothetical protein ABI809_04725 [Caldimonas sp.]
MARRFGEEIAPRPRLLGLSAQQSALGRRGWHSKAYALIGLQFCLAAMNIRGACKSEKPATAEAGAAD